MRFPEVGEIFAARYRIESMLGSGGFSRVYMATQTDLDRKVAIKILQPPLHSAHTNEERAEKLRGLISRFEREAKMLSKLRCPHTITVYDHGRDQEGQLFMSIEYVDGMTLSELIRREGALSPNRVAKIMRQVLMSLYEAHELGMLHRDIKPQNIMVFSHMGMDDQVKLLDFGIVKLIGTESRDHTDLTSDDTLVGTPRYMAPEYIRGAQIGPSSDLYSLGLVMYELLVGERAIQADSSIQIIGKQLERDSFYLPQSLVNVDLALRAIINGMVEKDTTKRYDSASKILKDIEARSEDRHALPPFAPALPILENPLPARVTTPMQATRHTAGAPQYTTNQHLHDPTAAELALPELGVEPITESNNSALKIGALAALFILLIGGGAIAAIVMVSASGGEKSPEASTDNIAATTETRQEKPPADAAAKADTTPIAAKADKPPKQPEAPIDPPEATSPSEEAAPSRGSHEPDEAPAKKLAPTPPPELVKEPESAEETEPVEKKPVIKRRATKTRTKQAAKTKPSKETTPKEAVKAPVKVEAPKKAPPKKKYDIVVEE